MEEAEIRDKLRNALLEAANQIDISDDPYEAIDLVTHFLEEEFEVDIFEEDVAMQVRIQEHRGKH